ncbi:hypothetical protein AMECASPLE_011214 [Ameca splendens]|uniref:Uncharacterized protein n=1 Tax=Ameca splendens TaxID=208324 RepID=A0ABV0ZWW8_9TELE
MAKDTDLNTPELKTGGTIQLTMSHRGSCLHFGPAKSSHRMTEGTSQMDRADRAKRLIQWIQQQEEDARALHREDMETQPFSLLLEEMERTFGESRLVLVSLGYLHGWTSSSPPPPSPVSTPAFVDPADIFCWPSPAHHATDAIVTCLPSAATKSSSSKAAAAELSSSVPATAEPFTPVAHRSLRLQQPPSCHVHRSLRLQQPPSCHVHRSLRLQQPPSCHVHRSLRATYVNSVGASEFPRPGEQGI